MVILKPGDLITECYPYAHCVTGQDRNILCHYCLKKMPFMKRCSKCRIARYCSSKCQALDWEYVHKLECKYFKIDMEIFSGYLFKGDTIRLILRIPLMNKKNPHKATESVETFYGKRSFSSLTSHSDEIFNEPTERSERGHSIALYFRSLGLEFEMDYFREIYSRVVINSFGMCNYFLNRIGSGVYIAASVFNHSCSVNACHVLNGLKMEIRATKEFDTQVEDVSLFYINPSLPRQERLDALADRYYFSCKCPRCKSPSEEEDAHLVKSGEELVGFMQKRDPQSALKAGLKFLEFFCPYFPEPTAIVTYVYDRLAHICETVGDERASYFREEWRKYLLITYGKEPHEFLEENQDPALLYKDP